MNKVIGTLTVYFEKPFWVGVFERIDNGQLSVAKIIFGAEPKDCEILDYVNKHYTKLQFSPALDAGVKEKKRNPKRMQREAKKQTQQSGIGTKAQQALRKQQEQNKYERKTKTRQQKEADALRKFELKQKKRIEKHKGH